MENFIILRLFKKQKSAAISPQNQEAHVIKVLLKIFIVQSKGCLVTTTTLIVTHSLNSYSEFKIFLQLYNKKGACGPPEPLKCGMDLSSEIGMDLSSEINYNEVHRSIDHTMYIAYPYLLITCLSLLVNL